MSDSITKPDHRTLPRRKRPLSTRDQAILLAYRTQGRTQAQHAADFRLSQSRISQILRRAERLSRNQTAGAPSRDQTWSRSAENQPSTQNSPGASLLPANDDAQIPNPKS